MALKFSVLLSLYYKENPIFLTQALGSVFKQSLQPSEVVLVIDGPITEELQYVVDEFKNRYPELLKLIPLEKNVGLGSALNEGLKHCSYNLVARMDTDDICKENRFKKQIAIFEKHPDISVVGSWVDEFIDDSSCIIAQRRLPETNDELIVYSKKRSPLNHPSVVFKKTDILSVGGYKHFYLFEDYYLWARLIINQKKLYNIQESLLYFRGNPQMMKRRGGWKYAKSEIKLMRELHRLGLFGYGRFLKNIFIRVPIRIMPTKIRAFIYKKFLR